MIGQETSLPRKESEMSWIHTRKTPKGKFKTLYREFGPFLFTLKYGRKGWYILYIKDRFDEEGRSTSTFHRQVEDAKARYDTFTTDVSTLALIEYYKVRCSKCNRGLLQIHWYDKETKAQGECSYCGGVTLMNETPDQCREDWEEGRIQ